MTSSHHAHNHPGPRPVYTALQPAPDRTLPPLRSLNIPLENSNSPSSTFVAEDVSDRHSVLRQQSDPTWSHNTSLQPEYSQAPQYRASQDSHQLHSQHARSNSYHHADSGSSGYTDHLMGPGYSAVPPTDRYTDVERQHAPMHEQRKRSRTMPVANMARESLPQQSDEPLMNPGYAHPSSYTSLRPTNPPSQLLPMQQQYSRYEYSQPAPGRSPANSAPHDRMRHSVSGYGPDNLSTSTSSNNMTWGPSYPNSAPYPDHQQLPRQNGGDRQHMVQPSHPVDSRQNEPQHNIPQPLPQRMAPVREPAPPPPAPAQPQQLLHQAYHRPSLPNMNMQYQQSTVHPHQLQQARYVQQQPQRVEYQHEIHDKEEDQTVSPPEDYGQTSQAMHQGPSSAHQDQRVNKPGALLTQNVTSVYPQNGDPQRYSTLSKIISNCTILNDFAVRYGELRKTLPSHRPSTVEIGQMTSMANEVVALLEDVKLTDLTDGERSQLEDVLNGHGSNKRTRDEMDTMPTATYTTESPVSANPITGSSPLYPSPEEDMETIRQKRANTTAIASVPGPPVVQAKGKYRKRGRSTPPGKCHSCNSRDTPEWRRGPDGARTLCNACGLHYAKLTRKREKSGGEMPPIDIEMLRASARAADSPSGEKSRRAHKDKASSSMDVDEDSPASSPVHQPTVFQIIREDPAPKYIKTGRPDPPSSPPVLNERHHQVQWNHQFATSDTRGYPS